jgi:phospholipid transport system substrate-binding protein
MIKKTLLIILLICSFNYKALSNENSNNLAAELYIKNTTDEIFKIAAQKKSLEEVRIELSNYIRNNIDIKWVAKFTLGKNWRRINKSQRKKFITLFEQYLINNYTPKFTGYNGETYIINNVKSISKNKYISNISLTLNNNISIKIEIFFIKDIDNNFKIVDISGEGISFAATQRAEFSSLISTHGIKEFLVILEKKVNNLLIE